MYGHAALVVFLRLVENGDVKWEKHASNFYVNKDRYIKGLKSDKMIISLCFLLMAHIII